MKLGDPQVSSWELISAEVIDGPEIPGPSYLKRPVLERVVRVQAKRYDGGEWQFAVVVRRLKKDGGFTAQVRRDIIQVPGFDSRSKLPEILAVVEAFRERMML